MTDEPVSVSQKAREAAIETDAAGEALVCVGCGTTRTIAAIKANSATAFSCCPERKMIPARDMWRAYLTIHSEYATAERAEVERLRKWLSEWKPVSGGPDFNAGVNAAVCRIRHQIDILAALHPSTDDGAAA